MMAMTTSSSMSVNADDGGVVRELKGREKVFELLNGIGWLQRCHGPGAFLRAGGHVLVLRHPCALTPPTARLA